MSRHLSGLRAWLLQRLSALYMGIYLLIFLFYMLFHAPADYQAWRDTLAGPWMSLTMMLFFAALLIHAWVGIRDVILDYAHNTALRLGMLTLTSLALLACGLWVLDILLTVMA